MACMEWGRLLLALSCFFCAGSTGLSKAGTKLMTFITDIEASEDAELRSGVTSEGIRYASEGNVNAGILRFRAATWFEPWREDVWANLGIALHTRGSNLVANEGATERVFRLYGEAVAAIETSQYLANSLEYQRGVRGYIYNLLDQHFPGRCLANLPKGGSCATLDSQREAMMLVVGKKHKGAEIAVDAVKMMCSTRSSIMTTVNKMDYKLGIPSAFFARSVVTQLRVCGVMLLPDIFEQSVIKAIQKEQNKILTSFLSHPVHSYNIREDLAWEHPEYAKRNKDRFEHKLPFRPPFTDPGYADNRWVLYIARLILTDDTTLDTFSFVTSLPGAPSGHLHKDVPSLFQNNRNLLPTFCLTGVAPLDPLNETTGPTMYILGSHQEGEEKWTDLPTLKIEANLGSLILYDVRLRHMATPNKWTQTRSIAYLSYASAWWSDRSNFKMPQSSNFDTLDFTGKKLFAKIDSQQYTKQLEEAIAAREGGKDILESLQTSLSDYRKVDLKLL